MASVERELKFAGVDHEGLRRRLLELEAEVHDASSFEDNQVFDRRGELKGGGAVLRLRKDGHGARVTFKGPAVFDGAVKVRPEHETRVEDPAALRRILEALGYEAVRRYQKYREEWRLGSLVICLDHTPIGDFAEIEGEGCETVARRLGLDPETTEKRSYLKLYEDYLKEHPDAPPDMVFREKNDED